MSNASCHMTNKRSRYEKYKVYNLKKSGSRKYAKIYNFISPKQLKIKYMYL